MLRLKRSWFSLVRERILSSAKMSSRRLNQVPRFCLWIHDENTDGVRFGVTEGRQLAGTEGLKR